MTWSPMRIAALLMSGLTAGTMFASDDAVSPPSATVVAAPEDSVAPDNSVAPVAIANSGDQTTVGLTDAELLEAVAQLTSVQFSERQAAAARLRSVSARQIPEMVTQAREHKEAEVVRVVFEVLGDLYAGNELTLAFAAGEALETAVSSDRWMIAESAAEILDRDWQRRCDLAMTELRQLGATFNVADIGSVLQPQNVPNNFMPRPGMMGINYDNLQISLNKNWSGGERGVCLLLRLADVTVRKALFGGSTATIYLIDGHSLQEPEVVQLRSVFGDRNVVIRGRVCLGIVTRQPQEDEGGCRVSDLKENSSAHLAGILPGDLITHVNSEPVRDFDTLVALLRKYDVGDKVTMSVSRGGLYRNGRDIPPGLFDNPQFRVPDDLREPKKLKIEVELKGWN